MQCKELIKLKIPQMGEGLRNVRIIKFFKNPGDFIKEDEIIYEMETDKSAVSVESTHSGYLQEWLASEGQMIEVNSNIAIIRTQENFNPSIKDNSSNDILCKKDSNALKNIEKLSNISPRVLRYCQKVGIDDEELKSIPFEGSHLSIKDIDVFINRKKTKTNSEKLQKKSFSIEQKSLIKKFNATMSVVVPASVVSYFNIEDLRSKRKTLINNHIKALKNISITEFQIFAYVLANVINIFPKLRSRVIDNSSFIENDILNLGIATQSIEEELKIAVIKSANKIEFAEFVTNFYDEISTVITDNHEPAVSPHVVVSYLGIDSKILFGTPLLVSPSVATIALSTIEEENKGYISITFDHRIINGSDINNFINQIAKELKT